MLKIGALGFFFSPIEIIVIFISVPLGLRHPLAAKKARHVVPNWPPGCRRAQEGGTEVDPISQKKVELKPEVNHRYFSTWP